VIWLPFSSIIANIARLLGSGGPRHGCRVHSGQAPTAHPESRPSAGTESTASDRIVAALCALLIRPASGPFRDRHQTVNRVEFHMRANTAFVFVRRRKKVRQVYDGGNVQGLLGQCALAIVATLEHWQP
jgi:hypothetical protein